MHLDLSIPFHWPERCPLRHCAAYSSPRRTCPSYYGALRSYTPLLRLCDVAICRIRHQVGSFLLSSPHYMPPPYHQYGLVASTRPGAATYDLCSQFYRLVQLLNLPYKRCNHNLILSAKLASEDNNTYTTPNKGQTNGSLTG